MFEDTENMKKTTDFDDPFGDDKKMNHEVENSGRMNYPLETIEEDPRETDSKLASKISYRLKPDASSEYNFKNKNTMSQDRNYEINDFESYNETVENRSMVDSNAYFKENPTNEIFGDKR
jgi:hypothetical protein